MYYNRTLTGSFANLIAPGGDLRWLFDYVRHEKELDFLIGKNATQEWISVYRGLSRVVTIQKTKNSDVVKVDGADAYRMIKPSLYGKRDTSLNFCDELDNLIKIVAVDPKFDRYYNNRKEGYYQNELSRKYGICGSIDSEFVVVDKEATVGYANQDEKDSKYGAIQDSYKNIQRKISAIDEKKFGKNLEHKAIGNELDFLALDKQGRLLLIEYKDAKNTSGIYLSPLQIGMSLELFKQIDRKELENAVLQMVAQKQRIGLINKDWKVPAIQQLIPVLIISNYNEKSCGKMKFHEIMEIARREKGETFLSNIETYNYTSESGLSAW